MTLKDLQEKRNTALMAARAICDEAEKGSRDFTDDERGKVAGYLKEAADLKVQIEKAEGDAELRRQINELGKGLEHSNRLDAQPGEGKTLGERFVNAELFKSWFAQVAPSGRIPDNVKGLQSPPIEFQGRMFGRKTLVTGADDTQAGAFVQTDYTGIYEPLGRMPLVLRNLINVRRTTSDTIEFVRQTTQVTQAAAVAEANVTEYTGATGEVSGEKPEAAVEFEKVTETVKTLAVWIPATKRALSDAAQIRGIIDQELRDDLMEEFEDQILNGDGVGENFTGILNTAGVLTQAWDTDLFRTARQAKTTLQVTGRATPTAWVLNPADWETIELTQDAENRYYYGGPMSNGEPRLWGVPVVESEAIDEGTALLGDFRKAVVWDRESITISVSDSHEDFFIRNMIAILAEMRAAFGLIRPSAFVIVDFAAGS